MRRYIEYAIIAAVVFLVGKTIYNFVHDQKQSNAGAVMAERLRQDSLQHIADSAALANSTARLDSALARGTVTVDRWHTVKEPVYIPATSTPHDTIQAVARRLSACYAAGDSLVQSIVKIKTACSAYRDTATKTIADQRRAYAHLDSLYRIGKPAKRWGIGPYIGYGLANDGTANVERRASVGISLSYHIIQW